MAFFIFLGYRTMLESENTAIPNEPAIISMMEEMLIHKQLQIQSLLEVTKAINGNRSAEELFSVYQDILISQMGVGKLLIYINNDDDWTLACQIGFDEKIPVFNAVTYFEKYKDAESHAANKIVLKEFDIILPVKHKEKALGLALIGEVEFDGNESFPEKIKFLETLTNLIIVAIENKRLFKETIEREKMSKELELAGSVQNMLIPDVLPNNEFYEMSAIYLPHQNVGGDYYDVIPLGDDEIVFCIADISGKGIGAAMLMANFQATLRTLIRQHVEPDKFIRILNKRVNSITNGDKFITFFIGKYNHLTRELVYVNAGHNPSLMHSKGKIVPLDKGCTILGMFPDLPSLEVGSLKVDPNALIFNFTDGLTDLENGHEQLFGEDRILNLLNEHHTKTPAEFNNLLIENLVDFKENEPFNDDISMLTCRFV